ncbi:uncharacterized protein KZ484_005818 [Pholidichthys leucotaenia]
MSSQLRRDPLRKRLFAFSRNKLRERLGRSVSGYEEVARRQRRLLELMAEPRRLRAAVFPADLLQLLTSTDQVQSRRSSQDRGCLQSPDHHGQDQNRNQENGWRKEKLFSCDRCGRRFWLRFHAIKHKCDKPRPESGSDPHQAPTFKVEPECDRTPEPELAQKLGQEEEKLPGWDRFPQLTEKPYGCDGHLSSSQVHQNQNTPGPASGLDPGSGLVGAPQIKEEPEETSVSSLMFVSVKTEEDVEEDRGKGRRSSCSDADTDDSDFWKENRVRRR